MISGTNNNPSNTTPSGENEAGKFNTDLINIEMHNGTKPGQTYARVKRTNRFTKAGPGYFVAKPENEVPHGHLERGLRKLKRFFIGRPLYTAEEGHQRLNKVRALAVFGSDPISSCAYATEASLAILILAGAGALNITSPAKTWERMQGW
jgi:hypothetical protein